MSNVTATPIEAIPATQVIRTRLAELLRETAITRRLLKLAVKRDQMESKPAALTMAESVAD